MMRVVGPTEKQLACGTYVDLLNPPETVPIASLVHSVCRIPRFGGHSLRAYSVGAHSLAVAESVARAGDGAVKYALVHDLHEALLGDIGTPNKLAINKLAGYDLVGQLTEAWDECIFRSLRWAPTLEDRRRVKIADTQALRNEREMFMARTPDTEWGLPTLPDHALDWYDYPVKWLSQAPKHSVEWNLKHEIMTRFGVDMV